MKEQLEARGYDVHIELYNSKYWDVPQNRERYFITATLKGAGAFEMPKEQHENVPKLSLALDKEVDEKYFISDEKAKTIIMQALQKVETLGDCHACITPERLNKRQNGPRAKVDEKEMFTLTAQDIHGVIIKKQPEIEVIGLLDQSGYDHGKRVHSTDGICPTLTAVAGGTHHIKIFDTSRYRVRKLTPKEYGRLQAFPVDEKWEQVVSDSQAYKQFGNAVTVNVVAAIAEAIKTFLKSANQETTDLSDAPAEIKSQIILNDELIRSKEREKHKMNKYNLRPCLVKGKKAFFHRWAQHSDIISPSEKEGGHGGGMRQCIVGLVEFENGEVARVRPEFIMFSESREREETNGTADVCALIDYLNDRIKLYNHRANILPLSGVDEGFISRIRAEECQSLKEIAEGIIGLHGASKRSEILKYVSRETFEKYKNERDAE